MNNLIIYDPDSDEIIQIPGRIIDHKAVSIKPWRDVIEGVRPG